MKFSRETLVAIAAGVVVIVVPPFLFPYPPFHDLIAFVTAFYLLGKIRLPHERPVETIGALRMLASMAFLAIAFYLFTGLLGSTQPRDRLTDLSLLKSVPRSCHGKSGGRVRRRRRA